MLQEVIVSFETLKYILKSLNKRICKSIPQTYALYYYALLLCFIV